MADPVVIGYGQNKWIKDANTKMITLTSATFHATNTGSDLESPAAGAAATTYTVPAGKVFILLWFRPIVYGGSSKEGFFIYERYGATNYVKSRFGMNLASSSAANDLAQRDVECYMEFQAGSTIRIATYAAAMSMNFFGIGVETNV
jgi:hypothetical protein